MNWVRGGGRDLDGWVGLGVGEEDFGKEGRYVGLYVVGRI